MVIDYIYLNFKKIHGFDPIEKVALEDTKLLDRREARRLADVKRDEMFGPRRSKFYDVGVDLGDKKKKK